MLHPSHYAARLYRGAARIQGGTAYPDRVAPDRVTIESSEARLTAAFARLRICSFVFVTTNLQEQAPAIPVLAKLGWDQVLHRAAEGRGRTLESTSVRRGGKTNWV